MYGQESPMLNTLPVDGSKADMASYTSMDYCRYSAIIRIRTSCSSKGNARVGFARLSITRREEIRPNRSVETRSNSSCYVDLHTGIKIEYYIASYCVDRSMDVVCHRRTEHALVRDAVKRIAQFQRYSGVNVVASSYVFPAMPRAKIIHVRYRAGCMKAMGDEFGEHACSFPLCSSVPLVDRTHATFLVPPERRDVHFPVESFIM